MNENRGIWRGKSVDPEEWIEGYFAGYFLNERGENTPHILRSDNNDLEEVIPETLGECTGLTDKNGKRIFDRDIIRYTTKERSSIYGVCWNSEAACFAVYGSGLGEKSPIGDFTFFDPQKCEVLGNVFDSPELL